MQLSSAMNVSSVHPVVVSTLGGSEIVVRGSGFMGSVYCGVSGVSWSSSKASVVSTSEARCVLPARGDGMRVVGVSMSAGGEISHSGVQMDTEWRRLRVWRDRMSIWIIISGDG